MLARIERELHRVSAIMIAVTMVLVVMDVALGAAGLPTHVAAEVTPFLMPLIVFFPLPVVSRIREHIRADFFDTFFSSGIRRASLVIGDLLFLLVATIVLWISAELTFNSYVGAERTQGLLRISVWIPQLGMVVGLFFLWLRTVICLIQQIGLVNPNPPQDIHETKP